MPYSMMLDSGHGGSDPPAPAQSTSSNLAAMAAAALNPVQ